MGNPEKQAWLFLVASVVVWSFFAMRMLDGAAVAPVSARHMLWTYAAVVLGMIVSHAVIAAVLAAADGALPLLNLASVPTLLFALLTTLFLGHFVHQLATIWMYRR